MNKIILFSITLFLFLTSCSASQVVNNNYIPQTLKEENSLQISNSVLYATAQSELTREIIIDNTPVILPILPTDELNDALFIELSEFISIVHSPLKPLTIDFYTSESYDTKTYTFYESNSLESFENKKFFFSIDTVKLEKKKIEDFLSKKSLNDYMLTTYKIEKFTNNYDINAIEVLFDGINVYSDNTSFFVPHNLFDKEKRFSVFAPDKYNPVSINNEKYVALTFDDGPNPNSTTKLLEILKKHDVKATFFMVGYNIEEYPYIVKKVYSEGHDIGIHSYGHINYSNLTFDKVLEDIDKCSNLIYSAIGKKPYLVRPPFGAINENEINTPDYFFVNWNVDPCDWKTSDSEEIAKNAIKYTKNGSIILLHDIYNASCEAADLIISDLKEKGYRFVTISEFFDLNGNKADNKLHFFTEDYNVEKS